MTDALELAGRLEAVRGLLAAQDDRQTKLHDLLETIREQIRLGVLPEHRPEGLFKNIQDAVYAMRGRMPLLNDAAITSPIDETAAKLRTLQEERDEAGGRAKSAIAETRAFWAALIPPHPRCRDCADFDGRCQGDGPPCAPQEWALENLVKLKARALAAEATLAKQAQEIAEMREANLHHETGERITRKDLNNAYRLGQESGRMFAALFDGGPVFLTGHAETAPINPATLTRKDHP